MDFHSQLYAINTKLINIVDQKEEGKNPFSILQVYQVDYVNNNLIPWLDKLQFHSKKFLDNLDYKVIATLIYQGKHLKPEGVDMINNIADRMNNKRLSTHPNSGLAPLSEGRILSLLSQPP